MTKGFSDERTEKYSTYSWPAAQARAVARLGCNAFAGIDSRWRQHSTYTYADCDSLCRQAYYIYNYRHADNGNEAYGGDILGTALYMAGTMGIFKINLSSLSTTTPYIDVVSVNPNMKTYEMMCRFHVYHDTDAQFNYNNSDLTSTGLGSRTTYRNRAIYYVSGNHVVNDVNYAYVSTFGDGSETTSDLAAYAKSSFAVPLKNVNVTYATLPFARIAFYRNTAKFDYTNSAPMYPNWYVGNHTTCTYNDANTTTLVAATCTAGGWVKKTCTNTKCKYSYVEATPKLEHTYSSKVTAPTCTTDGYTTHTCTRSGCGHSYTDSVVSANGHTLVYTDNGTNHKISCSVCSADLGVGEHEFSNGECTLCHHVATKFLHFKTGSAEITWDWKLTDSSAAKASMDGSGNGKMYAAFNGSAAPSFYMDAASADKVDHPITSGDVVQIRMRVVGYTGDATNVSPSVSFDIGSGSFSTALTGDTINLANSDWQVVDIPINNGIYAAGKTIEQIKIAPFGDAKAAATVEIDYIYIGEPGRLPVTVTFVNYDGTFLEAYPIDMGAGVTYSGPTPTRPNSNNFAFTFKGWKDQSGNVVDPTATSFEDHTVLTAYYEGVFVNTDPLASTKKLVDDDNDLEDYSYNIEIDAATYGESVTIKKEYKQPLDITLVMDRSTSTCFPADESNTTMTWTITNNGTSLTNVLNKLDKSKPEGYYTATNWLGVDYVGAVDTQAGGYISYEDMKWDGSKWVVWQTIELYTAAPKIYNASDTRGTTLRSLYTDGAYELVRPASVLYKYSNYTYHHSDFGKWVPLATAYTDFFSRCKASFGDDWETTHGLTGYKEANMKFKIAVSRRGVMQDALTTFIERLATSSSQLPQGQSHRVSIVSYGYQAYVSGKSFTFTNAAGSTGTYTCSIDPGVSVAPTTLTSSSKTTLKNIINKPFAFGATSTDNAFTYATEHQNTMRANAKDSQGIVILFTDGAPTYGDGFFKGTANEALKLANAMKTKNTKVFTVGYMDNLNAGTAPKLWSDTDTIANQANTWLHLMSSNYTGVTAMPETADAVNKLSGNYKAGYYKADATGNQLSAAFEQIYTMTETTTKVQTAIEGPLEITDVVTREWDLRQEGGANYIKVEKYPYLGLGAFDTPVVLDSSLYTLETTTRDSGETEIKLIWKDAPNAWLREKELAGANNYMGYKIMLTIGIVLDRDSTIGGNNIPTNTDESGICYPNNHDLDHKYDIPNVNVELLYDYDIHDYFMDLYNPNAAIDLIRAEKNDAKTNNDIVHTNMYSITQAVDGWNNYYVSIKHYLNKFTKETIIDKDGDEITTFAMGDSMVEQNLTHGTTTWSKIAYDTAFDFSKDNSLLTAGYTITQTTFEKDSLGRDPFQPFETALEDGIVNYYAPKYTVLDFGTKVEVPLDNEAYLDMGRMSDMIGLSDDTMSLTYNFMNGTKIMNEMGTFQYNVTAINAPKGASDNNVARTFTVLPANNVMYEETYLTNDGNWVDLGLTAEELAEREERVQSENVTTVHGYDSNLHELGKSEDYSFNHAYVIEASAAKNNKTLTFSFTGTGFDVISRTGPEDGVMVVEVYTDEAMTKKVDTALSINYLKDTTLYQIPVVRFMEIDADKDGDPDYGTYYVKIRAYYWDGFNPNYSATAVSSDGSARKDPAIKQVCADLGITVEELEEILAASGLSGNTKPATRNAAGADNSYEVVVDGIRIYNPLGTVTQAAMPEAYYIYGKANELNPTFINARDALLDATTWTFDGANDQDANGIVYIAAGSSNTNSSEQVSGIHLSMDGALKTKTVDGVEYLLDAAGNFVQAPGYTSNVYVRKVKNEESGRTTYNYFCKDASGNEINVTGKMKITYWNSNYDVNGPKNEIYLQYNSGVAFNVGTNAGRVMIGAKSSDGQNVFLQVYSEKDNKFVNVYAHASDGASPLNYSANRTELYYDVTDYVTANGDVIIRNPLEKVNGAYQKGVMSISGIKLLPKDVNSKMGLRAPASTVQKAVELIGNNALPEITTLDNVNVGEQLHLENDLTMVFRVKESLLVDYDLSTAYLVVERDIYGSDGSVTVDVQILREYTVMDGRVVFTYSGISAAQMNDEIRLIMHIFDIYGNEYVTKEKTTSVANYLKGLLEAMPTGQDKLYTLVMDMLNYGTAAQMYFDRHTDAPVNEAFPIFAEYASYASAGPNAALENLGGQIANEGSVAKLNQALDLGTRVGITYKVTLPEGMDPADAKLVIKDAEGKVLDTLEVAGNATDSRGRYLVTFYGSTSRDMRRVVYATVVSGDAAISDTYTYSISTYAWGVYLQGGNPELTALTQAMVIYGDSAVAYFG